MAGADALAAQRAGAPAAGRRDGCRAHRPADARDVETARQCALGITAIRRESNHRYDRATIGMATTPIDLDTLAALYRTMARIRAFEDAAERASQGGVSAFGQQPGGGAAARRPRHLSAGQEAVAAGVCAHLQRDDLLTSTHRGHGHTLAKGADLARTMAELFGRATGFNGGRGGSMHIADFSVGMLGANGVVAAGLPIAVGAAHALKLRGSSHVVACFFGDGAINRGPFLEALKDRK